MKSMFEVSPAAAGGELQRSAAGGLAIHWAIDLTARLRYSARWEDGRTLLRRRGIDPVRCVVAYMGPAGLGPGSACCELLLPNGTAATMEFTSDPSTERLVSIEGYEELSETVEGPDIAEARRFLLEQGAAFDSLVAEYFTAHSAEM